MTERRLVFPPGCENRVGPPFISRMNYPLKNELPSAARPARADASGPTLTHLTRCIAIRAAEFTSGRGWSEASRVGRLLEAYAPASSFPCSFPPPSCPVDYKRVRATKAPSKN